MNDIHRIWELVRQGDPAAWRQLVRLYAGLVHTVALRVGLSAADAEDCAQHTWISLYRRRHAIKDPVALPAWLIRTTHRQAVAMARRLVSRTDIDEAADVADPAALPDEVVTQLQNQALIAAALEYLDTRCRRLLAALFLSPKEKSYREIARLIGVKPNSLGPLRERCLARLRKILAKMGFQWD